MEDVETLREKYLNLDYDEKTFEVDQDKIIAYAKACGEIAPRFTDPTHADFQAPPTFPSSLMAGRHLPEDFPRFGGIGMDAGKAVEPMLPIRPGVQLKGRTHLHDIYTKTGRSGRMIFLVSRMELYDPEGKHVANADTSTVIRERSSE
ncbi:MAG: MaoC family dehydratase N-terminal domain-containing protein [Gammaproteobacteria bacterium]|nr:MaoC family dehydratase N-terminal domain-containing protein [Gammaproteobacteria bacterium]